MSRAIWILLTVATLLDPIPSQGAAGDVDLTFDAGTGGIGRTAQTDGAISKIVVLPNDQLLIGGAFTNFSGVRVKGLVRRNADGTHDDGFAANLNLGVEGESLPPYVMGLERLADNRILFTAVHLLNVNAVATNTEFSLSPSLLFPNGSRDESFQAATNITTEWRRLFASPQFDGAYLYDDDGDRLRRINADGSVSTNFPAGGESLSIAIRAMAIQTDGKPVLFGTGGLVRLNTNGTPDSTFPAWTVTASALNQTEPGEVNQLLIQSDGKIVVVGRFSWLGSSAGTFTRGSIARLNADGSIDSSFDPGSGLDIHATPGPTTNSGTCFSVVSQPDGKLILGGSFASFSGSTRANLVRIDPDGAIDSTFDAGPQLQSIGWVGLQSTGDILVAGGQAFSFPLFDFVVRLNHPAFTNGPAANRPIVRLSNGRPRIVQQPGDVDAIAGTTAQFSVTAVGSSPLAYQWYFMDYPLTGATSSSLSIPKVQPHQTGNYYVVVTNAAGMAVSSMAFLTVDLPEDSRAPALTITSPAASFTRVTSNSLTVGGRAVDAVGLSNVTVTIDSEVIVLPLWTNNATWSTTLSLQPGTNFITVRAEDLGGNTITNRRVVFYSTLSPITISSTGLGTWKGATNGQWLEVGRSYALTAQPGVGHVFSNWTGSVSSPSATLAFVMQSNLTLTANFVTNPFARWAGSYNGLFFENNGVRHESSGFFNLELRPDGRYSARLHHGTGKSTFTGKFDLEGRATNLVKFPATDASSVELSLDLQGADQITGRITNAVWEAVLLADRAVFDTANQPAIEFANRYTTLIPGSTNLPAEPAGDSPGGLTVDTSGTVKFSGYLADGSPVTQRVPLSKHGVWPLYVPLYRGLGAVLGWLQITNADEPEIHGLVHWSRPAGLSPVHVDGFNREAALVGSVYVGSTTSSIFEETNAVVIFSEGDLGASFTNTVTLPSNGQVTNLGTNTLKLSVSPTTGQFKGTVLSPATGKPVPFKGAVLSKPGYGGGFFLGTNQSGRVYFGP